LGDGGDEKAGSVRTLSKQVPLPYCSGRRAGGRACSKQPPRKTGRQRGAVNGDQTRTEGLGLALRIAGWRDIPGGPDRGASFAALGYQPGRDHGSVRTDRLCHRLGSDSILRCPWQREAPFRAGHVPHRGTQRIEETKNRGSSNILPPAASGSIDSGTNPETRRPKCIEATRRPLLHWRHFRGALTRTVGRIYCARSHVAISCVPLALWDKGRGERV